MVYNRGMKNERDLRTLLNGLSHEQLVEFACQMDRKYNDLQANYDALRRKYYGVKNSDSAAKGQLSLFNEIEETVDDASENELAEPETEEIVSKKKKKKNTPKNSKLKNVEVKTEDIYPDDRNCPECGKPMSELKATVIEYLEFQPAKYVLKRFVLHNYTCHNCNEENLDCQIYTGDRSRLPARLIDSSIVTPSVIANIAANKFLLGLPFYRQSKDLAYRGISISRQVLCQWLMRAGDDYLVPVYERMITDMRSRVEILNMDETTLECLEDLEDGARSKSYTWLAMSGIHEKVQMALYFYHRSREHGFVSEILGPSYNGIIQSDGYGAYDDYEPASGHAGCAAHCQRKYTDAAKAYSVYRTYTKTKDSKERERIREENPSFARILHILDQFNQIYAIEHRLAEKNTGPEETVAVRNKEARPLWEEIRRSADDIKQKYVLNDKLKKAIVYTENQYTKLLYYLNEPRLTPDNNIAEREGIKPYVQARKNYLFADTRHGAKISCIYFSLLISARLNGLNPENYLKYLLEQLSTYGLREDVIERCLPYSGQLPENLYISKNHPS